MFSKILSTTVLVLLLFGFTISAHRVQAMEFLFKDPEFSFQCIRIISQSVSGAADIGEVVSTAARIKENITLCLARVCSQPIQPFPNLKVFNHRHGF